MTLPSFLDNTAFLRRDGEEVRLNCCEFEELLTAVLAKEDTLEWFGSSEVSFKTTGLMVVVLKKDGSSSLDFLTLFVPLTV